jgi:hypothetical protein
MIGNWLLRGSTLTLLLLGSITWADEPEADPNQPPVVKLTLHPAAPGKPALKYALVPHRIDRKAGNAAQFYYRAQLMFSQSPNRKAYDKEHADNYERWTSEPCQGKNLEEIKKWLAQFPPNAKEQLREAVYREECDFDYRLRERSGIEIIQFLLPEIQEMRNFGRHLYLEARVAIAERRYDDAAEVFRMGYQMGRDTASEPLLINGLVGIAISGLMNAEVEDWIGSPESPNLYWSLASIPKPLVDLRPALQQEVRFPELMFPFLKDAETSQRSPEEWQRILSEAVRQINSNLELPLSKRQQNPLEKIQSDLAVTALIMRAYPVAKEELKKSGFEAEKLEKMPVAQVVTIHMHRIVREIGDEFSKGAYLPSKQREEFYGSLGKRMHDERFFGPNSREVIPLAGLLMPAVGAAMSAQTRLDRDFAALQTLEAIRAHLAETGALPEKLSDITVLPVPVNPATNEPFEYRLADGKATLEVPPVRKTISPQSGKRYEIIAAKK